MRGTPSLIERRFFTELLSVPLVRYLPDVPAFFRAWVLSQHCGPPSVSGPAQAHTCCVLGCHCSMACFCVRHELGTAWVLSALLLSSVWVLEQVLRCS